METTWMYDRIRLYRLMQSHPDWSIPRLAAALQRSVSWVKKWRRRFREARAITFETFLSRSRAPKTSPQKVSESVVKAVLSLRKTLGELYHQRVGPKRILYHLREDTNLEQNGHRLPRSATTVWRILQDAGIYRCRERVDPIPVPRPEPMSEWEVDFGERRIGDGKLEFWTVVDRGTSVLVDLQGERGYNAESALLALTRTFITHGCPKVIRLDNDPRFVASWTTDGFPSALERFLLCLNIEVHRCDPASPWQKPFVERVIGTVKHEYLEKHQPPTLASAQELLTDYPYFYNHDRPNQALVCDNQPPYRAFPLLPNLPSLPDRVNPDGWLRHRHGMIFRRTVSSSGSVMIDKDTYSIGRQYAKQRVVLYVDANERQFWVLHHQQRIKTLPIKGLKGDTPIPFQDFLKMMVEEARSMEQYRQMKQRQRRR